ncbi:YSIRK-type signal peptide-containing protein, partial [Streptococcus mitis]|uniref:YSIRK-type signal peptide-containing protein n=1 Tax=Streptococcus mitis TaxID=28037 RepID=UPI001145279B
MRKSNREVNGEKVFRYSIRKCHFGAASVAVAALMFFANGAVKADTLPVSSATANTEKVNAGVTNLTEGVPLEKSLETEGNKEIVAPEPAAETSNKEDGAGSNAQGEKEIKVSDKAVIPANQTEEINKVETNGKEKEVVTNKDKLESLLKEIDQLNLKDYTEDTVKVLQEKVAKAKEVLVNAKTQKEIDSAYNALVGYKNAGLKRVPKPKGELIPKPDTTNGKATVGIKAENTEPNGTNIAGHNHSMNRTSLPEGSGLRAVPEGDVTFYHLDGSMETEAGRAPDARYILKFRRGRGYRPQYTSATTTGAYLDYTGQRNEGEFVLRTFATRGSDAEVGTYDFRLRFTDSRTGEIYVDQALKVNVKPNKPTVTVENLENAAGKRAVVKSTARNSNDSIVEFYLNNTKKATITAVNGTASWTPDEALQVGDKITTRNIARDREFIPATYGGNINVARSTSDLSDAVTIPAPTTPTADKTALNTALSEET